MRISVVGAGAWGTVLARHLVAKGHAVRLWAHEPQVVESIRDRRVNDTFLPGVDLPPELRVTHSLGGATADSEMVVTAVPSQHLRQVAERFGPHVSHGPLLVSVTKGIEEATLLRMSEVLRQVLAPRFEPRIAVLSGPTFAREVAGGQPTALVAASVEAGLAERVQIEFSTETFRIYTNSDVIGVELGGAVKNVIAIAAGVCAGLGMGHNPIAAVITRGLAEISRLSEACGGRRETLAGLAGLGDLVLTCYGSLSRNRTLGYELGRGRTLREIQASSPAIAEGVPTTGATLALARSRGVEVSIIEEMDRLLRGERTPEESARALLKRPLKFE
jgi:glycerol-3-phosphate dehydrogenase (NAD(P)+)